MHGLSLVASRGLLFVAVRRLLIAVASLVAEHARGARASVVVAHGLSSYGLWAVEHKLSSCGAQAYLLRGTWDLPDQGSNLYPLHWQVDS